MTYTGADFPVQEGIDGGGSTLPSDRIRAKVVLIRAAAGLGATVDTGGLEAPGAAHAAGNFIQHEGDTLLFFFFIRGAQCAPTAGHAITG